jgi:hypothetical protein
MANSIEKTHVFTVQPESLALPICLFMKNKPVHIQWKCTWIKEEDYYYPSNMVLEKVWRDPHRDDEIKNLKTMWDVDELEPIFYEYFTSGLHLQAEIIKNSINFD